MKLCSIRIYVCYASYNCRLEILHLVSYFISDCICAIISYYIIQEKEKGSEKEKDEDSSVEKDKGEKKDAEESKKETEPATEMLDNPSRVMQAQVRFLLMYKELYA